MPRKTKRQKAIDSIVKSDKLADDWRYKNVGYDNYIIDVNLNYNPEEDIIAKLDGTHEEDQDPFELMHQCIEKLPKRMRNIVWLYYFEGLTLKEIGKKYKFTKQNAHLELNKAKRELKRLMEQT